MVETHPAIAGALADFMGDSVIFPVRDKGLQQKPLQCTLVCILFCIHLTRPSGSYT